MNLYITVFHPMFIQMRQLPSEAEKPIGAIIQQDCQIADSDKHNNKLAKQKENMVR